MTIHQQFISWGLIFVSFLFTYGEVSAIVTKYVPQIGVVRRGTQVEGTVLGMQVPEKVGYRSERAVIRFPGPDGHFIRFHDLSARKLRGQPGEKVLLHYDPADPKGTATTIGSREAWGYVRMLSISVIISSAIGVLGILMLFRVIPVP